MSSYTGVTELLKVRFVHHSGMYHWNIVNYDGTSSSILPLLTFEPSVQCYIHHVLHDGQKLWGEQGVVTVSWTPQHPAVPQLHHQTHLPQGESLQEVTPTQSTYCLRNKGKFISKWWKGFLWNNFKNLLRSFIFVYIGGIKVCLHEETASYMTNQNVKKMCKKPEKIN